MSDDQSIFLNRHSVFLIEIFSDWLAGVNTSDLFRLRDALAKELSTRAQVGFRAEIGCGQCGMTFHSVVQMTTHQCAPRKDDR